GLLARRLDETLEHVVAAEQRDRADGARGFEREQIHRLRSRWIEPKILARTDMTCERRRELERVVELVDDRHVGQALQKDPAVRARAEPRIADDDEPPVAE